MEPKIAAAGQPAQRGHEPKHHPVYVVVALQEGQFLVYEKVALSRILISQQKKILHDKKNL
jgi:hypothetical protein